jgi:hypothetical protein
MAITRLYWVTTEDHCEDWFIVANSANEAAKFHEQMEGYDLGDATAETVLDIPVNIGAIEGWPSNELLESLGAIFVEDSNIRVVEISGRKYCEGLLESTLRTLDGEKFKSLGEGRLNETTKDSQH